MAALLQFEQGCRLSHLTFLFLHVTQDLACRPGSAPFVAGGVDLLAPKGPASLGEWLLLEGVKLFWLKLFCGLVVTGEAEKSASN